MKYSMMLFIIITMSACFDPEPAVVITQEDILDEAILSESVVELHNFINMYPNSFYMPEVQDEIDKLYSNSLSELNRKDQTMNPEFYNFLEKLLEYQKNNNSTSLVAKFVPPTTDNLQAIDLIIESSFGEGDEILENLRPINDSFSESTVKTYESNLCRSMNTLFSVIIPHKFINVEYEGRFSIDDLPEISKNPTIEVYYSIEPADYFYSDYYDGKEEYYIGIEVLFDVLIKIPGSDSYSFFLYAEPPEQFEVSDSYGTTLYEQMVQNAMLRLSDDLYELLTGLPMDEETKYDLMMQDIDSILDEADTLLAD